MLRAFVSASCGILQQAGSTICYGHRVLTLVRSYSRQGLRFVAGIGFCILWYLTADRAYDLLQGWGSASCDITQQTRGSGHGFLHLLVSCSRQGVRCVIGMGFCLL